MWIRRRHYETQVELLMKTLEAKIQLERMNAGLQTHVDWLTQHVNRLEHERGILTRERLHVLLPVPAIERANPDPADAAPSLEHGLPSESIPLEQILGSSMEDVGDAVAERLGISHDAIGQVVYGR